MDYPAQKIVWPQRFIKNMKFVNIFNVRPWCDPYKRAVSVESYQSFSVQFHFLIKLLFAHTNRGAGKQAPHLRSIIIKKASGASRISLDGTRLISYKLRLVRLVTLGPARLFLGF
jgi:hypothetical protein